MCGIKPQDARLPETNMETQSPLKTIDPLKGDYRGFHVSLGKCITI